MSDMTTLAATTTAHFDRTVSDLKQGVDAATATHTKMSETMMNSAKQFAAFNEGTVRAFAESGQILTAGIQELAQQAFATGQTAMTESLASMRAMATTKTAKERIELQANFARTSAMWSVSEMGRFAHSSIELAEKVSAPLLARATLAAETITTFKA